MNAGLGAAAPLAVRATLSCHGCRPLTLDAAAQLGVLSDSALLAAAVQGGVLWNGDETDLAGALGRARPEVAELLAWCDAHPEAYIEVTLSETELIAWLRAARPDLHARLPRSGAA